MAISLLVSLVNVFPGEVVVGWLALGLTGLCIKWRGAEATILVIVWRQAEEPAGEMESFFEITDSWTTSPSKELIKKTFAGHNMIVVGPPLKFVMVLAPGHAHQLTNKFHLTLIVFGLWSCLNHDTAPVLAPNFVTGDKFATPIKLCIATAPELNQICTRTAKTRARPSLNRDSFVATLPRGTRILPGAVVG